MTHSEQFNSTEHAKKFKHVSRTSSYIPTTLHQYENTCIIQDIQTINFDELNIIQVKQYMADILKSIQHAVKNDIYHLDLKQEHFGVYNKKGILLDWDDAIFINSIPNTIHATHIPVNIHNIQQNPTHKNLLNGIISELGFIFYNLQLVNSKRIYKEPSKYQFRDLFNFI